MNIRYRLYPYPVLAYFNDDYVDSKFDVSAQCENRGYDIEIIVNVELVNEKLNDMIKQGKAVLLYHLECAQSGYRDIHKTDKLSDTIVLKDSKLNGELQFCPYILANETLNDYYNVK